MYQNIHGYGHLVSFVALHSRAAFWHFFQSDTQSPKIRGPAGLTPLFKEQNHVVLW